MENDRSKVKRGEESQKVLNEKWKGVVKLSEILEIFNQSMAYHGLTFQEIYSSVKCSKSCCLSIFQSASGSAEEKRRENDVQIIKIYPPEV